MLFGNLFHWLFQILKVSIPIDAFCRRAEVTEASASNFRWRNSPSGHILGYSLWSAMFCWEKSIFFCFRTSLPFLNVTMELEDPEPLIALEDSEVWRKR